MVPNVLWRPQAGAEENLARSELETAVRRRISDHGTGLLCGRRPQANCPCARQWLRFGALPRVVRPAAAAGWPDRAHEGAVPLLRLRATLRQHAIIQRPLTARGRGRFSQGRCGHCQCVGRWPLPTPRRARNAHGCESAVLPQTLLFGSSCNTFPHLREIDICASYPTAAGCEP